MVRNLRENWISSLLSVSRSQERSKKELGKSVVVVVNPDNQNRNVLVGRNEKTPMLVQSCQCSLWVAALDILVAIAPLDAVLLMLVLILLLLLRLILLLLRVVLLLLLRSTFILLLLQHLILLMLLRLWLILQQRALLVLRATSFTLTVTDPHGRRHPT